MSGRDSRDRHTRGTIEGEKAVVTTSKTAREEREKEKERRRLS